MNCAHFTVKRLFLCANTLCLVIGLFTALVCALFMDSIQDLHLVYCLLGFAVGLITFVAALCGCRGVKLSSAPLLWLYCALLCVLFGTQLYITEHFHARSVVSTAVQEVETLWFKELQGPGPMAIIEKEFKCCGLRSYRDYEIANMELPPSCYYSEIGIFYYTEGCLDKVKFAAYRAGTSLKIISSLLTIMQFISLVLGCILAIMFQRHASYEIV